MIQAMAVSERGSKPIRLLIVDDHAVFRAGIRHVLANDSGFEIVGEAATGGEAIALAEQLLPDVVLLDLSLPGLNGIEATRRIAAVSPAARVLGLSTHEDNASVQALLEAGAAGYVSKRTVWEHLARAIVAVATGGTHLDPLVARDVLRGRARSRSVWPARLGLSERETEVIQLTANGYVAREIAEKLQLSPRTLETYKARAMFKLGLKTRAELMQFAVRSGWLQQGEYQVK